MARPLPQIEVRYAGAWHTVTQDVASTEEITAYRGRRNWAALADPSEMVVPFLQHESKYATAAGGGPMIGRYAPRNPLSDLYGLIGRNTPVRLRLGSARPRLFTPGIITAVASTPDVAALRLAGDQRVEILVNPVSWRPPGGAALGRRYETSPAARAWVWWLNDDGKLTYRFSTDGSSSATRTSTAAVPDGSGELWLAAWIDINNGASGHTVGFETSPDGITWTALGSNVVTAGTTGVFAAQVPLEVGRTGSATSGVGITGFAGEIGAFRYRSGILPTSTIVSSVDFRTRDTDQTSFADAQGRTWTLAGGAYITDSSIRFAGEAASWPQEWDASGKVRSSPATVAGVLRRAQKTTAPLQSSLRRDFGTKANVVRYYPLEERSGSTRFGSAIAGDTSFLTPTDTAEVKPAANGDAFVASDPLPTFGAGELAGAGPSYTPNVSQRLVFLVAVPADGIATDRHLARVYTSGTAARWEIVYAAGGGLRFRCYDDDGAAIFDHGPFGSNMDGQPKMMSLWLEQQGSDLFSQLAYFDLGGSAFVPDEGTLPSRTFGRITRIQLGTTVGLDGTVMGHVALLNGDVQNIWTSVGSSLIGWAGETGTARLVRLGADEGFPVRLTGPGDTPAMGPQRSRTFVDLAREVAATDLGMFTDAAGDSSALAYRPARSMLRDPVLTVPYAVLVPPPLPVDDDQGTVNRVTVKSANGLELTAEDTTSTMSTAPPPAGVGLYDQSVDINANTITGAEGNAWWRLALGTVDSSRWPEITFALDKPETAPYVDAILAAEAGDIIRVTDLPPGVPPGPIDLIIEAIGDKITRALHWITFTCSPAGPWGESGTWGASTGTHTARYDTAGAITAGAVTASQTSITVTTTLGPTWTTAAADLPLDVMIGGERMTATAIGAPSGQNQVFTVTRGVNGISKAHPAGAGVALADPTRYIP
jgi:hypothetical protein